MPSVPHRSQPRDTCVAPYPTVLRGGTSRTSTSRVRTDATGRGTTSSPASGAGLPPKRTEYNDRAPHPERSERGALVRRGDAVPPRLEWFERPYHACGAKAVRIRLDHRDDRRPRAHHLPNRPIILPQRVQVDLDPRAGPVVIRHSASCVTYGRVPECNNLAPAPNPAHCRRARP